MQLSGKVAIVTGASAGIGRIYALALAGEGALVVASARTIGQLDSDDPERNTLAEVAKAGRGLPGQIHAHACDVGNEAELVRMIDQASARFGCIDILVNNAAIMKTFDPFEMRSEDWDEVMRVNLRAPFLAMRHVAAVMMREKSGSIVNITAGAGAIPTAGDRLADGMAAYATSKAGLNRLSCFMAERLKPHGIAVNALSPGSVMTETALAELEKIGRPGLGKPVTLELLAPPLLYLARQTAETLTGRILHADGFGKSWPDADSSDPGIERKVSQ